MSQRYYPYFLPFVFAALVGLTGFGPQAQAQRAYYVDGTVAASGAATDWATAMRTIQEAVDTAGAGDSVFVRQGTYTPSVSSRRNAGDPSSASFTLKSGVLLYGGFAGTETQPAIAADRAPLPSFRPEFGYNVAATPATYTGATVLSGALSSGDFCYHVVWADNVDNGQVGQASTTAALLDGFVIQDGRATATGPDANGGGVFARDSRLRFINVAIEDNRANNFGGGIYSEAAHISFQLGESSPLFLNNRASQDGGGYYLAAGAYYDFSTAYLVIRNRAARNGGGLYLAIDANQRSDDAGYYETCEALSGGGLYLNQLAGDANFNVSLHRYVDCQATGTSLNEGLGGGWCINAARIVATNCVFSNNNESPTGSPRPGNSARRGGGIAVIASPGVDLVRFRHLTLVQNSATEQGGGLYVQGDITPSELRLANTLFAFNREGSGSVPNSFRLNGPDTRAWFGYCLFQEAANRIAAETYATVASNAVIDANALYGVDPQLRRDIIPVPASPVADAGRNIYQTDQYETINNTDEVNLDFYERLRTCVVDIGAVEVVQELINSGSWTDANNWSPFSLLPTQTNQVPNGQHNVIVNTAGTVTIPNGQAAFAHNLYFERGTIRQEDQSTLTIRRRFQKFPGGANDFDPGGEADGLNFGGTVIFENDCRVPGPNNGFQYVIRDQTSGGLPVRWFSGELAFNGAFTFNRLIVLTPGTDGGTGDYYATTGAQNQAVTVGAGLLARSRGTIFIKRVLDLEQGDFSTLNNLHLLSNVNYTAIVVNRTVGPNQTEITGDRLVTIDRYVDAYQASRLAQQNGLGYNYVSPPVSEPGNLSQGVNINQFANNGAMNPRGIVLDNPGDPYYWFNLTYRVSNFPTFFKYEEGENTQFEGGAAPQAGWRCVAPNEITQLGRGYCVNLEAGRTFRFRGVLTNGNYSINVTRGNSSASGWNLLGNPYPSHLNYEQLIAANSGLVDNTIWLRTATSRFLGTWATYVAGTGLGGNLPGLNGATDRMQTMQGFMVRARANGLFNFTNAMRPIDYAKPRFFREEGTESASPIVKGYVRLEVTAPGGQADQAIVYFHPEATEQFDPRLDGEKAFFNSSPVPGLYTLAPGKNVAINGLPAQLLSQTTTIPLALNANAAGAYRLHIDTAAYFANGTGIYVEDKTTGTVHNLREGAYTFQTQTGRHENRLVLRLVPNDPGLADPATRDQLALFPNPAQSHVGLQLTTTPGHQLTIILADQYGKVYQQYQAEAGQPNFYQILPINQLPRGLYLISVKDGDRVRTQKFIKE
ncbi:MAG: T9SS type A sorting domain-containing protein [Bernardetiaceae bacterium]|nr:T9SS type A sorting domain-containing protein [Bernardetiaceae bacterium]